MKMFYCLGFLSMLIVSLTLLSPACAAPTPVIPTGPTPTPTSAPVVERKWEPTSSIEFVIPAGMGGGADIYARFISSLVTKHNLSPKPLLPTNRAGGAGAVAMDYVWKQKDSLHVIMITLNSFIATPLQLEMPINWKNFTPVANLAWDPFFLWVHKDSPWMTVEDVVKAGRERSLSVSGTGTKQEDEILFASFIKMAGMKPVKYVPYPGGGDVAKSLAGKVVEVTVNNPSEGIPFYPELLRPLAVFLDKPVGPPFDKLPTMAKLGYPINYVMMRAIFMPPDVPRWAQEWYVKFFKTVFDHPEFQKFAKDQMLEPKFITGKEFTAWIETFDKFHVDLMRDLGWIK